jgi:hypothetical protein
MTSLSCPKRVELADITIRDGFQHEEKVDPDAGQALDRRRADPK